MPTKKPSPKRQTKRRTSPPSCSVELYKSNWVHVCEFIEAGIHDYMRLRGSNPGCTYALSLAKEIRRQIRKPNARDDRAAHLVRGTVQPVVGDSELTK